MISLRSTVRQLRTHAARRKIQLHSADSLRYIIQRERFRSDRVGREFSLIALRILDSPLAARGSESDLIRWLQHELRITDDVGLLDDGRFGIVLPETGAEGAEVVADRIRLECATRDLKNELEISVYPDDPSSGRRMSLSEQETASPTARGDVPTGAMSPLQSMIIHPLPVWKRTTDIVVSGLLILITAPLQLAVAAAIKLTSPGPIIFTQQRSGLGGQPYHIFKFRTMCDGAQQQHLELLSHNEQDGPAFKMKADPRITPIGKFLRTTSLDELPQLFNVLLGDMSLVGPRPLPVYETDACEPWQKYRLDVTPGITCVWQVYGRGRVGFDNWVRMDVEYIRSRSIWQDAHLICMTLPAVLSGRGAA
jgi:lipopolysaccharide/colanic/teichoic acid biosynthesis glycosyltransferase